jgi:hypothetical protein
MRLAISGAHRTGKTTLMEELAPMLPSHVAVDEPYHQLEEEGHEFAAMPSVEDFELQLQRSLACLASDEDDQIFDRCPADFLAYLLAHEDADGYDVDDWLPRVRSAMQRLDLIVYVPIESPDRVAGSGRDEDGLRVRVDEQLRDILIGDRWDIGAQVIEVSGPVRERVRQVMAQVAGVEPS